MVSNPCRDEMGAILRVLLPKLTLVEDCRKLLTLKRKVLLFHDIFDRLILTKGVEKYLAKLHSFIQEVSKQTYF